jgi:hypothetical protein
MIHGGFKAVVACCLATLACDHAVRASDDASSLGFFETRIRPVLIEHCHECHSAAAEKVHGGLRVDSRDGLRRGGDSGPAVAPGEPDASLLLAALRHDGFEMPPSGRLPDDVVADFAAWIEAGAVDPREHGGLPVTDDAIDVEAGRRHWSFQPITRPDPPPVRDNSWPASDIDRFTLAALEEARLSPAPDADRATWLRRVTFDLTGLPPTPAEIDAFVADTSSEAWATVVDRLLASPRFGERMARHWLDIARFAESSGGGRSLVFKEAWRYRDYVIDAFNHDMPIDRFITEQLAGDLLPAASPDDEARQLIATGYLMLGAVNYEEQDKRFLEMNVIDEQLDTIGQGLLGMTLGCARCHDHKFDPVPTEDYYALAGILASTKTLVHRNVSTWTERPLPMPPELAEAVASHKTAVRDLTTRLDDAKQRLASLAGGDASSEAATDEDRQASQAEVARLEQEKKQLAAAGPDVPRAMAAEEADMPQDCAVCIRGDVHNRGAVVPRGVLQVATVCPPPAMPAEQSGRRELAAWIADAEHPLTSRVFVNRIWQQLFGRGLVATPNNFGTTGEPPSHPSLLDHLSRRLTDGGWSTKRLIRGIVLSRTYRQRVNESPPTAVNPGNALLSGVSRRRLDAESLRDAILAVAGTLDDRRGGPGISDPAVLAKAGSETPSEYTFAFTDTRRSIYTPAFRNRRLELFEIFDAADPNAVVGRRPVSTVATQSLYLLNSPFVMEQATAAARRLLAVPIAADERCGHAFRLCLGRPPTAAEHAAVSSMLGQQGAGEDHEESTAAWTMVFQSLFGCIDFRTLE